ncbi:SusC/RagA family TonB-linked outer membrane protein [Ekhidna sp. To15]|uniref:SusC/RagA family TonB-linked outer membrane protein n=1 Tax=Ekhidna sp. To15 TaxID=3395267 RepID=UPI003F520268
MKRNLLLSFAFFIAVAFVAMAQRTVSGKITDDTGESLPGVNVVIKGTTTGVTTDLDGNFRISVDDGATLIFSYVGFETQEIEVGARTTIDVTLGGATELQEVVVVGYGTTLKTELTSAIASVGKEDIERLPNVSPEQSLQGLASGVFVQSQGGQPGGAVTVRVRGQTSVNAGAQPLYVVDGVVISNGDLTQNAIGGEDQNVLATLNPQDIESIQVLKDAASTAIYGARAANGVVLITTKRGTSGKAKIDFRAWTGVAQPLALVEKLSGPEQIAIEREGYLNDSPWLSPNDPSVSNETLGWDGVTDSDLIGAIFRDAVVREYNISASGGNEALRYFVSGGYRDEEGVMLGSNFERISTRLNVDYNASDDLTIGTSLSFASNKQNLVESGNNIFGTYGAAILAPNYRPIYDSETGEFVDTFPGFNTNPVRAALQQKLVTTTNKFLGNWNFTYKLPVEGLAFRTDLSYDWNYVREDQYQPETTAQGRGSQGFGNYSTLDQGTYNIEPTLRFSRTFGGSHKITAVAGMTWQNRRTTQGFVSATGFARGSLAYIRSAAVFTNGDSFRLDQSFMSGFGRVNYAYDEKYLASISFRRDGSSQFGPDNKFGNFYAFSVGWNFSEEDFFNLDVITFGKIRASYGVTGNDQIGNFQYVGTFSGGASYLDQPGLTPSRLENPQLNWEETTMTDVGLELAMFNNRLNMNAGVFRQETNGLLFNNQVPWTTGFASFQDNVGVVVNEGIELDLNGVILDLNGFQWTGKLNLTFMRNEVKELNSDEPILSGFASAIIQGEPINTFYALKWLGVDPATGNSVFEDFNGDGAITSDDNQVVGNHSPEIVGGLSTGFSYKGITLDAFFQFVEGVDVYNNTHQFSQNVSAGWGLDRNVLRRWRQPGDVTDIPRASQTSSLDFTNDNSRFLSDGSYIRLKNVTLAYSLPSELVSKAKLRNARIYVQGTNLITWTAYNGPDPEISAFGFTATSLGTDFLTFPNTKMFSVGVNLGL